MPHIDKPQIEIVGTIGYRGPNWGLRGFPCSNIQPPIESADSPVFALLVARCALQMFQTGYGSVVVCLYFSSIQPSRFQPHNLRCETQHLEHPDAVPVHVYLVPL